MSIRTHRASLCLLLRAANIKHHHATLFLRVLSLHSALCLPTIEHRTAFLLVYRKASCNNKSNTPRGKARKSSSWKICGGRIIIANSVHHLSETNDGKAAFEDARKRRQPSSNSSALDRDLLIEEAPSSTRESRESLEE
jgi:hypothetical protein